MAAIKSKSKLGYLKSTQVQRYIDSHDLDQYDMLFISDQKTWAIIDKDLNVIPITTRIDAYQSENEALIAINGRSDTYDGQIINVLVDGKYVPYVINTDSSSVTNAFIISRISSEDYNEIKNKPIINIIANDEIILSDLDDGFYTLVGSYRFCDLDETHRMTSIKKYFIIESLLDDNNNTITHITEFGGVSITKYICSDTEFIEDRYVLQSELGNKVEDILDVELPGRIDDYIEQHQATDEDIRRLFPD